MNYESPSLNDESQPAGVSCLHDHVMGMANLVPGSKVTPDAESLEIVQSAEVRMIVVLVESREFDGSPKKAHEVA